MLAAAGAGVADGKDGCVEDDPSFVPFCGCVEREDDDEDDEDDEDDDEDEDEDDDGEEEGGGVAVDRRKGEREAGELLRESLEGAETS